MTEFESWQAWVRDAYREELAPEAGVVRLAGGPSWKALARDAPRHFFKVAPEVGLSGLQADHLGRLWRVTRIATSLKWLLR